MARYAEWIMQQRKRVAMVIDVRTPITVYTANQRKKNPDFTMSGDGVHIDNLGHLIFGRAVYNAWTGDRRSDPNKELLDLVSKRQKILHDAWLSHVGHKRPGVKAGLPLDKANEKAEAIERRLEATKGWSESVTFPKSEQPVGLFNGRDLTGWEGQIEKFWSVDDGVIKAANKGAATSGGGVPSSTYLFTKSKYRNFRLILEVKQTRGKGFSMMHSAVAVLGEKKNDKGDNAFGFTGPLLICCNDWGIWEAYRRNRTYPAKHRGQWKHPSEKVGDWNRIEILVIGNRIRMVNNGNIVIDFTDKPEMLQESPICLQLHSNRQPQEFRFRGLIVSENPADELLTATK